jgi:hypothetical protein
MKLDQLGVAAQRAPKVNATAKKLDPKLQQCLERWLSMRVGGNARPR